MLSPTTTTKTTIMNWIYHLFVLLSITITTIITTKIDGFVIVKQQPQQQLHQLQARPTILRRRYHNNNNNSDRYNNNNYNNNKPWTIQKMTSTVSSTSSSSSTNGASSTPTSNDDVPKATTTTTKKIPGTADLGGLQWSELGFEFRPTNSYIKIVYTENEIDGTGSWGTPELVRGEPMIHLHIGATALHYGQACFEGLKAFTHSDNSVHIFRPDENAARMQSSCRRTLMPELPTDLFISAVEQVVIDNIEYVPPYGSNGSLYIRPLLFGSGPRIGLQPSAEYTFICLVIPVGDYYKGGLSTPVKCLLITDYDRAAPRGVGNVKVAGNYAADILPNKLCKQRGYPIGLYLDAATQSYIEEFSTSNFVGINNTLKKYVTPKSGSVLPSITNKSLMQIAELEGYTVEARNVPLEELSTFDEVLAVGTAVVVTPVGSVTHIQQQTSDTKNDDDNDNESTIEQVYEFGIGGTKEIGTTTRTLYDRVRAIQNGEADDIYQWNYKINY